MLHHATSLSDFLVDPRAFSFPCILRDWLPLYASRGVDWT